MFALALLVVVFVVTGGALFAALGAVTGASLTLAGPRDILWALGLATLVIYGVTGAVFWSVVGRVLGRPPHEWFKPGYPITSLMRDDLRTTRWLALLASALREAADQRRDAVRQRTGSDPGPQFPAPMADEVDEIRRLYTSGDYHEANRVQKHLANWVTRMGRGDAENWFEPAEIVRMRAESDEIMALWKHLWNVAADVKASEAMLEKRSPTASEPT